MASKQNTLLLISSDLSHPALSSQQYSFSWRLNRLRPLAGLGYRVVVVCAAGRPLGSRLRNLLANLKPSVVQQDDFVFVSPPILSVPVLWFFTSMISTPIVLWLFCRSRGLRVSAVFAASVAFGAIAKRARMLSGGTLALDYGDPEYARVKGVARAFLRFLEDYALRTKEAVFTCMDPVIGDYMATFGIKNPLFLPPGGYWKKESIASVQQEARARTIVYAGHVGYPPYRIDLLIQAAPSVLAAYPDSRFVIVGDGKFLPEAKAMAKKLGLEREIIFVGGVSYNEAKAHVAKADLAVQLLDDMCLGTKVIDYFALGKPVLACGSFHDRYRTFLRNGENCVLVPPDAKRVADGLKLMLSDGALRKRLGKNALLTVRDYDWDSQARELLLAVQGAMK